ncbi:MAG: hypothetical protein ACI8WB_000510 [Phenylobacterium sp.]|jgi:hypothetical protein
MGSKQLTIKLTAGWAAQKKGITALSLHESAKTTASPADTDDYKTKLEKLLGHSPPEFIVQLDKLFRRRVEGFDDVNQFIGAMTEIEFAENGHPVCEINIFAYAFLKHAKNYDFFIGIQKDSYTAVKVELEKWTESVQALANFERLGTKLSGEDSKLKDNYLALRSIVGRPSARDEQRTLACLLIAGPSTGEEIKLDLGLNYTLNQRIMAALQATNTVVEKDGHYALNQDTLPIVLFLVRETIGLNVLSMMNGMEKELV